MRRILLSGLMCGALALAACGGGDNGGPDGGTNENNPNACGDDVQSVTAQELFDSVINGTGACTSCHYAGAGTATNGDLVMDSVEALKATTGATTAYAITGSTLKVVDPNHSENSTMFLKVAGGSTVTPPVKGPKGESVGAQMPQGLPPLSAEDLKMVKDWICSGAK
ncbi:MAG: hypothetical protein IRZ16_00355 [Myxococcaceae bacterium]|nr:hypothetical protein [Myxococcaceae bacterium]